MAGLELMQGSYGELAGVWKQGEGEDGDGTRLWGCGLGLLWAARRARCGLPCSTAGCSLLRAEREEGNWNEKGEGNKRKEKKRKNGKKSNLKISKK
jgi:hypothetical protein